MRLRVCTFGGEGACSGGAGERTLDALRLLSPPSCAAVGCSCLARCDRGVALQIEGSGEVVDEVNGGEACAALLRRLGMRVDEQLLKALALSERGDAQLEAGRPEAAVAAYRRAFSLATSAGLGVRWRSAPSSVLRVRERAPEIWAAPARAAAAMARPRGVDTSAAPSAAQRRWLGGLMVRRSRAFAAVAAQPQWSGPEQRGAGWSWGAVDLIGGGAAKANRNALEDAQYAVQLYELCNPEFRKAAGEEEAAEACEVSYDDGGEVEGEAAAWERLAEAYEASRDIEGAIYAYERLLLLEPPSAAALPPAVAAKRSVQELVLLSHRRGLQDARAVGSAVKATAGSAVEAGQGVGEAAVATFTERALADVRGLRRVIEGDLDVLESTIAALADMTADDNEEGEAESREVEEPPPPGSPLTLLARKAKGDVGTLRKIVRNDFNTLELQLLRGDPTLSAARDLLRWISGGEEEAAPLSEDSLQAMQLREQFEKNWEDGALPRDPLLVRSLLEQAKRDPELVARLILEAKDPSGRDLKAREAAREG